ncbi:MAG: hypothetical protein LW699_13800, partial [Pirellula sp.]|nr:hypothetical protein [Pirellula sp.]
NTQETTGYFDSPGSLRCSAFICRLVRNATSSMSRFDGIGRKPSGEKHRDIGDIPSLTGVLAHFRLH